MAQLGAKFDRMGNKGRGCLQLAKNCQGGGQMLANRLQLHVTDLVESHGKGRDLEDRSSGQFSKHSTLGRAHPQGPRPRQEEPRQRQGEGKCEGKCYEPQQGQAHANRHWGQDP